MVDRESAQFGALLVQHRVAAGLTQEQLAASASVSPDTIAALEHGRRRTPRGTTVELLVSALGLDGDARVQFVTAARMPVPARIGPHVEPDSFRATLAMLAASPSTPLVGRADDLAIIHRLLAVEEARLLTLTGPAGVGKTRLALAAAAELDRSFRDGVVFVDLTPIRDSDLVLSRLAAAIGLLGMRDRPLVERLAEVLSERQQLLVLDNFEQVLPAAAQLADLLVRSAGVRLLVTSRIPLQLRWERTLRVAPLPVPAFTTPLPPLDELLAVPSVDLFVQRARNRQAEFVLGKNNALLVARLTVQLDGLPLALELAAARLDVLSLPTLARRLGDHLRLLRWEAPDVPERQRSLEAAVGWSYDLLRKEEQRLFRRLGVFVGRVSLAAIDAVTSALTQVGADTTGIGGVEGATERILDGLLSLAKQSLLLPGGSGDEAWRRQWSDDADDTEDTEPTFGILETVREYAEARLDTEGELTAAQRAHAHYFLALAEQAASQLNGRDQRAWYRRLDREHDNVRVALRWLLKQDDGAETEAGLRLAGALGFFWFMRGYHAEGLGWLEKALAKAPHAHAWVRAQALIYTGWLLVQQHSLELAQAPLQEALALAEQCGDGSLAVEALTYLGGRALYAGNTAQSAHLLREALHRGRELGDHISIGRTLFWLGATILEEGSLTEAAALEEEALMHLEAAGQVRAAASVNCGLAVIRGRMGDLPRAMQHVRVVLQTSSALRDPWLLRMGVRAAVSFSGARGDPTRLVQLLAVANAQSRTGSAALGLFERGLGNQDMFTLREQLGQVAWDAAIRAGRALRLEEVASLALTTVDDVVQPQIHADAILPPASHRPYVPADKKDGLGGGLTGREAEVLRLVAQGLSSKVIGRQLFLSPSTVNQHVKAIFNKLGVQTRAQAVAVAARQNLL